MPMLVRLKTSADSTSTIKRPPSNWWTQTLICLILTGAICPPIDTVISFNNLLMISLVSILTSLASLSLNCRRLLNLPQSTSTQTPQVRHLPCMAFDSLSEPTVGLLIVPSLLDKNVQLSLLDKLLHRDLSNPSHKTNLHMHYDMAYPQRSDGSTSSFFSIEAQDISHQPKDPSVHKPLPMSSCLNRKLRWVTIGGQYDWTQKVYPASTPPPFPEDVAALVEGLFPSMKAQAAIVNLYTPSDTLSLHRDVSEECDRPLVSISLGCDAIFMAGLEGSQGVAIRLRSGDALVMSGPARYAWHGVPQILPGTCPDWMADWPRRENGVQAETYEHWKGWMARKRINLNVRQMWE